MSLIVNGVDVTPPASHTDSVHLGATANLLTSLTPSFAGWTQNPGTNADLVDELKDTTLTTNGIGGAGNNTITYDLLTSRRRIFFLSQNYNATASIQISEDNFVTTYGLLTSGQQTFSGVGKFRYVRYLLTGIHTQDFLKMRCENIN